VEPSSALTLKLLIAVNIGTTVRSSYCRAIVVSGPLWVSRIGKEDSALSQVTVRNKGA